MRCAGIDIGSRKIEVVIAEDGRMVESRQGDSGFDPLKEALRLLDGGKHDHIMATG